MVVKEGRSVIKREGLVPVPRTFPRVLMIQETWSHKIMKCKMMGKSAAQLVQRSVDGRVDVADSCLKHQILTQMHTT